MTTVRMTRDQLEAAIWRIATYQLPNSEHKGYMLNAVQVAAILEAADEYAAYQAKVAAQ